MTVLADPRCAQTTIRLRRARADDVPAIVRLLADDVPETTRYRTDTDEELAPACAFAARDADPNQLLGLGYLGDGPDLSVVGTMQLTVLPGLPAGERRGPRSRPSGSAPTSAGGGWVRP